MQAKVARGPAKIGGSIAGKIWCLELIKFAVAATNLRAFRPSSATRLKALIYDRYPLRSIPAKYFERIDRALVTRAIWGGICDHYAFDAQGFRHLQVGVDAHLRRRRVTARWAEGSGRAGRKGENGNPCCRPVFSGAVLKRSVQVFVRQLINCHEDPQFPAFYYVLRYLNRNHPIRLPICLLFFLQPE